MIVDIRLPFSIEDCRAATRAERQSSVEQRERNELQVVMR